MQDFVLYVRFVLALLFLTTAIPKWRDFEVHVAIVADYKIIPPKLTRPFATIELAAELLCSLMLFFGLFTMLANVGILLLLLAYTIAILTNLLRGRTEVSCGCGGAAGNHPLSWWLILRNVILLSGTLLLLQVPDRWANLLALFRGASFHELFPRDVITILFMAALSLLVMAIFNELQTIRHWFQGVEKSPQQS